jgi:hypothetical protein
MNLVAFIHSVGNLGLFPTRAFVPAFLTALTLRLSSQINAIKTSPVLQNLSEVPTWFTCDAALIIMGILAVLEIAATKSSDIRDFLSEFDVYIKGGMAFLTTAGVLSATDQNVVNAIRTSTLPNMTELAVAGGVAAGVIQVASFRQSIMNGIQAADPEDDFGLQRLISWFEDLWSIFGVLLLVIFPVLMLVIVAAFTGVLYMLKRYLEHREEKRKVPCANCGHSIYLTAVGCPSCKKEPTEVRAVGFLGLPANHATSNRSAHALDLISRKRCPVCATRFSERAVKQTCGACGHELMKDPAMVQAYLNHVEGNMAKTLGICGALSVIPVLGIIPGVIYYRIKLVGPFRNYLPFGTGLLVKIGVNLLNLIFILMQVVPIFGAFLVPLMAYTNYRVYRGVYTRALGQGQRQVIAAPAAPKLQESAPSA